MAEKVGQNQTCVYDQFLRNISNDSVQPIWEQYKKLPAQLTDLKKEYILDQATPNVRMMGLGFATLTFTLLSRKFQPGPLQTVRNLVLGYYAFGLALAPEVYNAKITNDQ